MFSIFKRSKKNTKALEGLLHIFFFPSPSPFLDIKPLDFRDVSVSTKEKILLFSYGVIDNFLQANKVTAHESKEIMSDLEIFFEKNVGVSLGEFMDSDIYKRAFHDNELLELIKIGAKTYNDFASKEPAFGGQALTRLTSLVSIWEKMR